jgi:hypothetical protein
MKSILSVQFKKQQIFKYSKLNVVAGALLLSLASAGALHAGSETPILKKKDDKAVAAPAEKPAPLPLHEIEGNGGVFATLSAYLVNPPRNGEIVGRPAIGAAFISLGHGQNLEAFTITETPWERLELGFGADILQLGDLPGAVKAAGGPGITENVGLYNFNARLQLLKEGEFNQKWLPALTFGTHFKYNDSTTSLNNALGGALHNIGITRNEGVDFTLYASKLITFLPRPVLINVGGRATESAWIGLLGFSNSYQFVFEGNVVVFITDKLLLAGEFRQLPKGLYTSPNNLITAESNWWTIDAAYVINKNWTVAVGYGNFGNVLNHNDSGVFGVTTKYEF